MKNLGPAPVHYQNAGVAYHPLTILNHARETVPSHQEPMQIGVAQSELAPGASIILAERIDIRHDHDLTKPGTYFVQFDGTALEIGEPVPTQEPGPFAENENLWPFDFVSVPARLPSETIEIQVLQPPKRR